MATIMKKTTLSAAELEALSMACIDDFDPADSNSNSSTSMFDAAKNKKRDRTEEQLVENYQPQIKRMKVAEEQQEQQRSYGKYRPFTEKEEEAIKTKLKQEIPKDMIKTRVGGGNTKLSYVSGGTVLNMLNETFGFNGWNTKVLSHSIHDRKKEGKSGGMQSFFEVIVFVEIKLRDGTRRQDVGTGVSMNGSEIDKAIKEATTDAIKRAAHQFGNYLGGQLYK